MPAETAGGPALADPWRVERDDDICVVRFDGGLRRTLTIEGAAQLAGMLAERAERPEPPVVVLAVGILHAELLEVLEMSAGRPIGDWAPWLSAINGLESYPSATLAVIEDQASCGGLELVLAADIRIVAPGARLGVLESRMGLIPGAGGTQRLTSLLGSGWANLLCLSGETISGVEAHRIGLAQILAPDAFDAAVALAERIASRGPAVLAAAKTALSAARATTAAGFRSEGSAFLSVVGRPGTVATMRDWVARQESGDSPARDPSGLP